MPHVKVGLAGGSCLALLIPLSAFAARAFAVEAPVSVVPAGGVVLRTDTHEPIPGARIRLTLRTPIEGEEPPAWEVSTDGSGRFLFPALPARRMLTGQALDTWGAPVAGARVSAYPRVVAGREWISLLERRAISSPDGGFVISALLPGESYNVLGEETEKGLVWKAGRDEARKPVVLVLSNAEPEQGETNDSSTARFTGKVFDAKAGAPIDGARSPGGGAPARGGRDGNVGDDRRAAGPRRA